MGPQITYEEIRNKDNHEIVEHVRIFILIVNLKAFILKKIIHI